MKAMWMVINLWLLAWCVPSQAMYVKTFGDPASKPLIFLHGGPGGSAIDFEVTTAAVLAERGFFVVVYDRRGEGRSEDDSARFTFHQTLADLNDIYSQYGFSKATLLGHSFGGIVATYFAELHPEKVDRLILAGTPLSLQHTFRTILQNVNQRAATRQDSAALMQVRAVQGYDTTSIYYSSGCFMLAMQNGLYTTRQPNEKATALYGLFQTHEMMKRYTSFLATTQYKTMFQPTMGFLNNERYTSINMEDKLNRVRGQGVPVYGIYGKEDGLFDADHIAKVRAAVGHEDRMVYLDQCSHGVFIDQHDRFVSLVYDWSNGGL